MQRLPLHMMRAAAPEAPAAEEDADDTDALQVGDVLGFQG